MLNWCSICRLSFENSVERNIFCEWFHFCLFHSFNSFCFPFRLMIIVLFQVEFSLGFICSMWFPLSKNLYNLIHYRLQPSKFRFVSFHTMRMQCTFLLPCETPLIISVSNSSSYYCLLFTPLLESAQKTVIFFFLFKSFRRNSKI